ncbi:ejaculatory bulb-specific protein 3-like [Aricia agestis]|uniref:ejaculatory bulb-specific protein 3-like n=1 Tax=Aricia agestis TaxID=91739 RepID=UPI001C20BC17|nr:ejaculatory bulb-specific protein 3-like [Aricia agestis]
MFIRHAALLVVLSAFANGVDYHDTMDDNHDFNAVMADKKLLRQHLDCYLDKGPCNDVMQSYKKHIPTFIRESCARCNPPQKHMLKTWLDGLEKVDPEGFRQYSKKYDPGNIYITPLRAAVAGF